MRREITPLDVRVESVKLLAGKKPTTKKEGSKVKHLHPKFLTANAYSKTLK